jgi:hypothetical protein
LIEFDQHDIYATALEIHRPKQFFQNSSHNVLSSRVCSFLFFVLLQVGLPAVLGYTLEDSQRLRTALATSSSVGSTAAAAAAAAAADEASPTTTPPSSSFFSSSSVSSIVLRASGGKYDSIAIQVWWSTPTTLFFFFFFRFLVSRAMLCL